MAATAAVISFTHVQHLAREAGEPELTAWLLPLSIDGAVAAAAAVILADSRARRRPTVLTWLMLGLGLAASLASNVASAQPTWTARAVAAWPPVALALGIEVLASMSRRGRSDQSAADGRGRTGSRSTQPGPARGPAPDPRPDAARPATTPRPSPEAPVRPAPPRQAGPLQPAPRSADLTGLHLVDQSDSDPDRSAIEVIRRLDAGNGGPVPRRTIEHALSCGASRAARLAAVARQPVRADQLAQVGSHLA